MINTIKRILELNKEDNGLAEINELCDSLLKMQEFLKNGSDSIYEKHFSQYANIHKTIWNISPFKGLVIQTSIWRSSYQEILEKGEKLLTISKPDDIYYTHLEMEDTIKLARQLFKDVLKGDKETEIIKLLDEVIPAKYFDRVLGLLEKQLEKEK